MRTRALTARVPLSLAEKVDELAARLERSRGWIVKQAVSAWIDQEEDRHRLTREALADVDAGHVIGHQAVRAWAASPGTKKPLPPTRRRTSRGRAGPVGSTPVRERKRRHPRPTVAGIIRHGLVGHGDEAEIYADRRR